MRKSLLVAVLLGIALLGNAGCGYKSSAKKVEVSAKETPDITVKPDKKEPVKTVALVQPMVDSPAHEQARKKQQLITKDLEEASKMIKGTNLDGALRLVQRVQTENQADPNVTMQTWYMQAMIYHRKKDSPKRKEAMGQMLKSMETLQKDPRFKEAYREGLDSVEVIKMTLDREGTKYVDQKE